MATHTSLLLRHLRVLHRRLEQQPNAKLKPSPAAAAASPACASWAEAASEAKRSAASQETNSCASCSSSFPWDGAPEDEAAAAGERGDGWGAFRPTYIGSWVEGFNRLGFDVVGLDMQGHGASDGWGKGRCIVRSLDDLAEDLLLLLRLLRAEYPQRHPCEEGQLLHAQVHPLQRGGAACRAQPHSLPSSGGGEGSRLQRRRRSPSAVGRLIRYAAAALAAVKPHTPLLPPGTRRRHPYLLHYYQSDPLTYKGGLPAGIAVPLMWEMEAATQHSELLQLQHQDAGAALLVHAVQDPLCDITGSVNCFSNLLGLPDRQLLAIEGPLPGAAAPAASTPANCQFDSSDMQRDLEAQHEEGSNGSGSVHEHAYEERMKGAADCRERKPRVIVARGIDVVHDLPNEPGQHLLFPLVAAWITSRCPEPQDQRIQQRTVHPQEHHQQEESNL
ncbi:hypothetical protein cyc_06478 [Cyclospora cayetanensis]|uniref:Serine aminopeptidase S33 domain-containing protein n=1 Tax=Cyclospora cayetanensis TaxID=88456 RepID=A0A1D3D3I2_9EIME|nr:hypothetical protein cyc_06478 [Cyclospora cayetanensis]